MSEVLWNPAKPQIAQAQLRPVILSGSMFRSHVLFLIAPRDKPVRTLTAVALRRLGTLSGCRYTQRRSRMQCPLSMHFSLDLDSPSLSASNRSFAHSQRLLFSERLGFCIPISDFIIHSTPAIRKMHHTTFYERQTTGPPQSAPLPATQCAKPRSNLVT